MPQFDPSQLRVMDLDPSRHARVLGAPGSGKSRLVVESFARVSELVGWSREQLLVLAPSRRAAAHLRDRLERRIDRALGGTPVRTPASLAFAVLARERARAGRPAPRLLTGAVQDELIARAVERSRERVAGAAPAEVIETQRFRDELRELWRVADAVDREPEELAAQLDGALRGAARERHHRGPGGEIGERWIAALAVLAEVAAEQRRSRPDEFTASGLLRAAARSLHQEQHPEQPGQPGQPVPRLILVDDAQQLDEGELALLAACARRGSRVWVFGDPDVAAGSFRGERVAVLTGLSAELRRRDAPLPPGEREQHVVLEAVHRHGPVLRRLVQRLSSRIGAAGAGEQRAAGSSLLPALSPVGQAVPGSAASPGPGDPEFARSVPESPEPAQHGSDVVQFARVGSPAEQRGALAHRLRARRLGLGGIAPLAWSEMAVICRSQAEASRVARELAARRIPAALSSGGLVLSEHRIVRELVTVLRHSLGHAPLQPAGVLALLGGERGGPVRGAAGRWGGPRGVRLGREALAAGRAPRPVDERVAAAFARHGDHPGERPAVDSPGGRALRRLARLAAHGVRTRAAGGTAREVLWAIWETSGLAPRWQEAALTGRGERADAAHRSLDAVMGLFFHLQRHEEQASEQPVDQLLLELLAGAVPEDSLAARSEREEVTVSTPQGVIGREFALVCVIGPQSGHWPNVRPQGSLLAASSLERWVRSGQSEPPSRRDTLHDELRLFTLACSRARGELLVLSVADEDHHPGPFFSLGREHEVSALPSSRLTLRGAVGEMRRRLLDDPGDLVARDSLIALAEEGIDGADPAQWYGVRAASSGSPLVELGADPAPAVPVSPSQLERAEQCPLDWVIGHLGGGEGGIAASLGTLLHHAVETVGDPDPERLLSAVTEEWGKLTFAAEWESERTLRLASAMVDGVADYLREFAVSGRQLLGSEVAFSAELGPARLTGVADRVELDGTAASIVDLKTGRTAPGRAELERHAQLQAYQLGIALGAFESAGLPAGTESAGARLVFVHPDAAPRNARFAELAQAPLDAEATEALVQRIEAVARVMAGSRFIARIEHHCSDPYRPGLCALHVVPPVSAA